MLYIALFHPLWWVHTRPITINKYYSSPPYKFYISIPHHLITTTQHPTSHHALSVLTPRTYGAEAKHKACGGWAPCILKVNNLIIYDVIDYNLLWSKSCSQLIRLVFQRQHERLRFNIGVHKYMFDIFFSWR